jgi:hypothetical protein
MYVRERAKWPIALAFSLTGNVPSTVVTSLSRVLSIDFIIFSANFGKIY